MTWDIHNVDCLDFLRTLPDGSVDAVVTDPPYGLSFMGKKWDYNVPSVDVWRECLRVLKPGSHLLSFGGSRTYHRMACNVEDAGFDIRDQIMWLYGSGFPKSHNLEGDWDGWGTALKPAHEPIVMARKPLVGTVAANVAEYGCGALNIDGCRVGGFAPGEFDRLRAQADTPRHDIRGGAMHAGTADRKAMVPSGMSESGRWPANLIHDGSDEVVGRFPANDRPSGIASGPTRGKLGTQGRFGSASGNMGESAFYGDSGSAARFFYCAKPRRADRDAGCEDLEKVATLIGAEGHKINPMTGRPVVDLPRANSHPTVKPTDLMRYLCRLVTPPGGTVLDPFTGSGSTGRGAILEGFGFIGCEIDPGYCEIARRRCREAEESVSLLAGATE